jgi:hypothetical protein
MDIVHLTIGVSQFLVLILALDRKLKCQPNAYIKHSTDKMRLFDVDIKENSDIPNCNILTQMQIKVGRDLIRHFKFFVSKRLLN